MKRIGRCLSRISVVAVLLFLLSGAILASHPQELFVGEWSGAIEMPGQALEIHVALDSQEGVLQGSMDIPLQQAMGIPLESFDLEEREIAFSLAGIPGEPRLELTLADDDTVLTGTFSQSGASFPTELHRVVPEDQEAAQAEAEAKRQEQKTAIAQRMTSLLEQWDVPGAAVGVISDGDVLLAQGFGYADLKEQTPVTANTVFAIGSASKAFTTAVTALMVDQGKLDWDRPVVEYLPWFRMQDDYALLNVTLRDFALHRSGLARHDFSWYGRDLPLRENIEHVRHLESAVSLRETFIYNNHGYAILGYLAGQAAGMEWDDLVSERLLAPLGMANTGLSIDDLRSAADHAVPYQTRGANIVPMDYRSLDGMGPAGSINSTVHDMLAWVELFLNRGSFDGEQILSPLAVHELTRAQIALPVSGFSELRFSNYALGWMVEDYRGDLVVHHGGNIDGYSALVAMVPEAKLGVVVLTNMNNSSLPVLAAYHIMDIAAGREPVDWSERMHQSVAMMPEDQLRPPRQLEGTQPSRNLPAYAGTYEHPGYGQVQVAWSEESEQLEFGFRGQTSVMEHWHYDVFTARIPGMAIGMNMPVHFRADVDGYISSLTLPLDPTVKAIEFALVAGPELREQAYLETFSGTYSLMGMEITVRVQAGRILLELPGQPALELVPQRPNRFTIQDLQGYSVDFDVENGETTRLWLNQPNGSFPAERVE